MSRVAVAYHESGHATVAWASAVPITVVSVRARPDRAGCTFMDADGLDEADAAAIFAAGSTATALLRGAKAPLFDVGGADTDGSKLELFCDFLDQEYGNTPGTARRLAILRAKACLTVRWGAVEAVAASLLARTSLLGSEVDRICRSAGVRRYREPIDPAKVFVTKATVAVSLREWSQLLDHHHHDVRRAEKALAQRLRAAGRVR